MLAKALLLKQLYLRSLVGERYCPNITLHSHKDSVFHQQNLSQVIENCHLCELSKVANKKIIGKTSPNSVLAFVTLKPILPFSASEDMIHKIATNIFNISSYSALSILKCDVNTTIKETHIAICKEFLKTQLDSLCPTLVVFFGVDILKYLLGGEYELQYLRGRILKSKSFLSNEQNFIVTYAINDLLKNPSLKRFAMEDFKHAREFLETKQVV